VYFLAITKRAAYDEICDVVPHYIAHITEPLDASAAGGTPSSSTLVEPLPLAAPLRAADFATKKRIANWVEQ
jgi:hypothetical protein